MQRSVLLLVCVVALSLVVNAAQPQNNGLSTTFTPNDATVLKSFLQTKSEKVENVHDAFYITQALAQLDTQPKGAKATELCNIAKDTLKSNKVLDNLDAESIFHAASLAAALKCDVTVDKKVTDAIKTIIAEGDSVPHYYHAVMAALSLRDKTKKEVSDDELTSVVDKIGDLTESDGTIRSSTSDKDGNLFNSGLALQLYARLSSELTLSEQDREHVDGLVDKVEAILELANEGDNTLSFSDDSSAHSVLATTSELARGFQALAKALKKPLDITPIQTARIGEYFLSHRYASTSEDAFYLLNGLRAVQQSPKAPLALTLERSSILATAKGAEGHIKVRLTDIFDAPVAGKVLLVKAHAVGKPDTVFLSNQEVTESLNFLAAKPEQGFYAAEFRAVPTDTAKYATIDSTTRRVKVIGSVSVTDFELVVSDSREVSRAEGNAYKAEYPKKIDEHIHIHHSQFIHAQFKVRNAGGSTTRPLVAQQAFLRFTNTTTGHEVVFVATPNENKVYTAVINLEEAAKSQFRSLSGEYTLAVVVGDAFIQNPIHWTVSTSVSIEFLSQPQVPASHLSAKPEIVHQFRKAEKRPPAVISTVFTALALAPLLFLLAGLGAVGANIKRFPTGADFLSAVAFVVSIGMVLLLIAVYWLRLNLIQTLGYLAVLAVPTIFFGQRALSSLARKEKMA